MAAHGLREIVGRFINPALFGSGENRPGIVSQAFGLCSRQGIVEGVVLQFILCVEAEGRREVTEFSRLPDLPRHPDTTCTQPGFLLLLIALRQGSPDTGWAGRDFWRLLRHLRVEQLVVLFPTGAIQ